MGAENWNPESDPPKWDAKTGILNRTPQNQTRNLNPESETEKWGPKTGILNRTPNKMGAIGMKKCNS